MILIITDAYERAYFCCIIILKNVILKKVNILVEFVVLGTMVLTPEDQDKNQDREQDRVMLLDEFALTSWTFELF